MDETKLKKYNESKKRLEDLNYTMIIENDSISSFGEETIESWWLNPVNGIPIRLTIWQIRQAAISYNG